ncbi:unnamed protein product [Didymodactylos carnosus]|uniref:Fork-head domain-containing protein n=1 Tax=Didymodactylos carnosus TaxID=1234261 RepID=A0A814HS40_9BILA|nr:unnamed protein product [Didymodactylos carnosus]CAF3785190.1 unnamed protein product [Didymodactylos carnosus]
MTQWPLQRNIYTIQPPAKISVHNPTLSTTTTYQNSDVVQVLSSNSTPSSVLTNHNMNTPRSFHSSDNQNHLPLIHNNNNSNSNNTHQNISLDDSLTNLSWLHDMNILKRTMPTIQTPLKTTNDKNTSSTQQLKRKDPPLSSSAVYAEDDKSLITDELLSLNDTTTMIDLSNLPDWRTYRKNPNIKPPYSYSQLIVLAMQHGNADKMTLQMIYEWIIENFPYFKKIEPTWQNSIRHNLSLNKCFMKVPRTKKEPGKGGFWKLLPEYEHRLIEQMSANEDQQQIISSLQTQQPTQNSTIKRRRPRCSNLDDILSDNVTPIIKSQTKCTKLVKSEAWYDPVLPCIIPTKISPLHCNTVPTAQLLRQQYHQHSSKALLTTSLLSPISSPDSGISSPFATYIQKQQSFDSNDSSSTHHQQQQNSNFPSILTPSPSTSPSSMSSISANNQQIIVRKTENKMCEKSFEELLLLESDDLDWDQYLRETATDMDDNENCCALLSTQSANELFSDFSTTIAQLDIDMNSGNGSIGNNVINVNTCLSTNAFDNFECLMQTSSHDVESIASLYNTQNFNLLFDQDEEIGGNNNSFSDLTATTTTAPTTSSNGSKTIKTPNLTIKGCGIKRPLWWDTTQETTTSTTNNSGNITKLPSLETAFDIKLHK